MTHGAIRVQNVTAGSAVVAASPVQGARLLLQGGRVRVLREGEQAEGGLPAEVRRPAHVLRDGVARPGDAAEHPLGDADHRRGASPQEPGVAGERRTPRWPV